MIILGNGNQTLTRRVEHCLKEESPGQFLVQTLKPEVDAYFVLKPKHSGFFSTTLDTVLRYLEAHTLILTGIAADRCVLFTANDAFLRDYRVLVPSDCVVANSRKEQDSALALIERVLRADVRPSKRLNLGKLKSQKTE